MQTTIGLLLAVAIGFCSASCLPGGESVESPATPTTPPPAPPQPNRRPVVDKPIQNVRLEQNGLKEINAAEHFSDPDGDTLDYRATSSDESIVSATISGSIVTLRALRDGTVTVTVRATDPRGLSIPQAFGVTVPAAVPPPTPTGLRVARAEVDSITWSWDEVEGALRYAVQTSANGTFTGQETIKFADENSFTLPDLASMTTVYARVAADAGTLENPIRSAWSTPVPGTTTKLDDHGNTQGTATRIRVPSMMDGELGVGGDIDYFRFELQASVDLAVYTTGSTDTLGEVTGPNRLFEPDNDSGEGRNFSIRISNAPPGVYFVSVKGFSGEQGEYRLHVELTEVPLPAPANFRARTGMDFITWSWDEVESAIGYRVQTSSNEAFTSQTRVDDVVENSFTRDDLAPMTTVYARVASLAGTLDDPRLGAWSTHVIATTDPGTTGAGVCLNSRATPSGSSAELVRDCGILLEARDELRGTARLNWSTDLAIESWDGVETTGDGVTKLDAARAEPDGYDPELAGEPHESRIFRPPTEPFDGYDPELAGEPHESQDSCSSRGQCLHGQYSLRAQTPHGTQAALAMGQQPDRHDPGLPGEPHGISRGLHLWGQHDRHDPDSLGNLTNLRLLVLNLRSNELTGVIPGFAGEPHKSQMA